MKIVISASVRLTGALMMICQGFRVPTSLALQTTSQDGRRFLKGNRLTSAIVIIPTGLNSLAGRTMTSNGRRTTVREHHVRLVSDPQVPGGPNKADRVVPGVIREADDQGRMVAQSQGRAADQPF